MLRTRKAHYREPSWFVAWIQRAGTKNPARIRSSPSERSIQEDKAFQPLVWLYRRWGVYCGSCNIRRQTFKAPLGHHGIYGQVKTDLISQFLPETVKINKSSKSCLKPHIFKKFGFRVITPLDIGLQKTIEWYVSTKWTKQTRETRETKETIETRETR